MALTRSNVVGLGACVLLGIGGILICWSLLLSTGCMLDLKVKIDPPAFQAVPMLGAPPAAAPSVVTPPP